MANLLISPALLLCASLTACSSLPHEPGKPMLAISSSIPADFETAEYRRSGGLDLIHASAAYSRGADGSGVKVALIDSGIDASHSELAGRVLSSQGWDYINGAPPAGLARDDGHGHGTHVAGIIAGAFDGRGVSGIAPGSQLISYRTFDNNGSGRADHKMLAEIVERGAGSGATVFNGSWTIPADIRSAAPSAVYASEYVKKIIPTVERGVVFVWGAGNDSAADPSFMSSIPYIVPEFRESWVAVVAVDSSTGVLAPFSNRCGLAADWCLAVPGTNILSSAPHGGYASMSGTSMAAPFVSGAIALLQSHFKNQSAKDVLKRLFASANKTGIYADKSIYGQGLLDIRAALETGGTDGDGARAVKRDDRLIAAERVPEPGEQQMQICSAIESAADGWRPEK